MMQNLTKRIYHFSLVAAAIWYAFATARSYANPGREMNPKIIREALSVPH
jgi:hypothetical protein